MNRERAMLEIECQYCENSGYFIIDSSAKLIDRDAIVILLNFCT